MLKKIFIVLIIILMVLAGIFLKIFVIGSVAEIDSFQAHQVIVNSENIEINGDIAGSAKAFSHYSYKMKSDYLYIKVSYVPLPLIFKYSYFNIKINGKFDNLKRIYFKDSNGKTKLIWQSDK